LVLKYNEILNITVYVHITTNKSSETYQERRSRELQ